MAPLAQNGIKSVQTAPGASPGPKSTPPIPTELTLACRPNHNLAEQGWTTRKISRATPNSPHRPASAAGDPAPGTHHHPEKLLQDNEDDEDNAP